MHFSELLRDVETVRRRGANAAITGVEYDSRRVTPGALFVAMRGEAADGNAYIDQAIAKGAVAVVTDSAATYEAAAAGPPPSSLALVTHGRRALAAIAAEFFGHPERRLTVSGVTGTNGKTTTTFLLDQMLRQQGRSTVLVGTIEYHVGGEVRPAPHTTPESRDLLALFAQGVALGATEAVMEVSSHALEQGRAWGVPFDVAIFTNFTRDHLDFHGSMDAYFRAKERLFDGSRGPAPRTAVINVDDPAGYKLARVAENAGAAVVTYGFGAADFRADAVAMGLDGMRFTMHTPEGPVRLQSKLTGRVNVYNLLAAAAAARLRGITPEQMAAAVPLLQPVPGRLELVDEGQDFAVAVDYAHTDDALRKAIALGRELVSGHGGRVITLFGCGGDRDRTKRPLMGRAAGEGSDVVVLTSDNPRSEDPLRIMEDVVPGLEEARAGRAVEWEQEPNRAQAIARAIAHARAGDFVLLAGKGHEKTQTIAGRTYPFDDVAVARQALQSRSAVSRAQAGSKAEG